MPDRIRMVNGADAGPRDFHYMRRVAEDKGLEVTIEDVAEKFVTIGIWGPNARATLQKVVEDPDALTLDNFPFAALRPVRIAGKDVTAFRISYVGEQGWELHMAYDDGLAVWDALRETGVMAVGVETYANSRRLEKSLRLQNADLLTEYNLLEADLARPKVKEADFRGKAKHLEHRARDHQPAMLCTLVMTDNLDAAGVARYPVGTLPVHRPRYRRDPRRRARPPLLHHLDRLRPDDRQEHRPRLPALVPLPAGPQARRAILRRDLPGRSRRRRLPPALRPGEPEAAELIRIEPPLPAVLPACSHSPPVRARCSAREEPHARAFRRPHRRESSTASTPTASWKDERVITSPQAGRIDAEPGGSVLNFCANNYLGLADHPDLVAAAKDALDRYGYGMASVRFICGTQDVHKALEARLAGFLGMDDAILYSSCFDANGGLFETLLGEEDAIISDALNHASIIDGVRLSKARRLRYANNDMADLERCLQEAAGARTRLIATDGVFSMDGIVANLAGVCDLAEKHDALVMVDDSHAVGFVGTHGRGSPEHCGVEGRVDILTGTLGKALGGASGGYTAASRDVVALLRQRSRPYLFSNSLAPVIAATSLEVLDLIEQGGDLRARLAANAARFRREMTDLGFTLAGSGHPIIPVMLGDAALAQRFAARMLDRGVYVVGFSFPVVPRGQARIRTQMSAAHTEGDVAAAIAAFAATGRELGVIA